MNDPSPGTMHTMRIPGTKRRHGATPKRLEAMMDEVTAGNTEMLIGICRECGQFYSVDDVNQPCSAGSHHAVDYYVLVWIRR
jgi:hypothetical protein